MPDFPITTAVYLLWAVALAGLLALALGRGPWRFAPLALHIGAIALCLAVLACLPQAGWPDLRGRVFRLSLALLMPWAVLALAAHAGRQERPLAAALAAAGALLYAGFFAAVGFASLQHDTPLKPSLAMAAMAFGGALFLLPMLVQARLPAVRRACAGLMLLLLLAAGWQAAPLAPPPKVRPALAP